jgi:hypothetical protein
VRWIEHQEWHNRSHGVLKRGGRRLCLDCRCRHARRLVQHLDSEHIRVGSVTRMNQTHLKQILDEIVRASGLALNALELAIEHDVYEEDGTAKTASAFYQHARAAVHNLMLTMVEVDERMHGADDAD